MYHNIMIGLDAAAATRERDYNKMALEIPVKKKRQRHSREMKILLYMRLSQSLYSINMVCDIQFKRYHIIYTYE